MARKKRNILLGIYTWFVIAVGFGILIGFMPYLDIDNWQQMLVLVIMGVLAEFFIVSLPHGSISLGFAVVIMTYLLFDTTETVWVSVLSAFISNVFISRDNPFRTTLFNAAQYALSATAAAYIYYKIGGSPENKLILDNAFPLIGYIGTYFIVNHLLVNIYLAPYYKNYTISMWRSALKWDFFTYLISTPIGLLMTLLYLKTGMAGAVLLFLPVLALKYFFKIYIKLDMANKELSVLYEVAKTLGGSLELEKTLKLILFETKRVVKYHTGIIYLLKEEENILVPVAIHSPYAEKLKNLNVKPGEGIVGLVAERGEPELIYDTKRNQRLRNLPGITQFLRSLIVIPLMVENRIIGVFTIGKREAAAFGPKQMQLLSILGGQAAIAMANSLLYKKIESLAITDGLTNVYNHRFFYNRMDEEFQRAKRYKLTFSLIMLDIDYFKKFNDQYGHKAGDAVLATVARILKESVRAVDIVARYGGEEFAIILPETGRSQAGVIAERVRSAVEKYPFELDRKKVNITVSVGVATYPDDAEEVDKIIEYADQALYFAKKSGRNKVCFWSPEEKF